MVDLRDGEAMTASPPADQPADHIGEVNEMAVFPTNDPTNPLHRLAMDIDRKRAPYEMRDDIAYALSLIARQEETIRADGEALERIVAEGDRTEGRWTHLKRVIALTARARVSARQGGGS